MACLAPSTGKLPVIPFWTPTAFSKNTSARTEWQPWAAGQSAIDNRKSPMVLTSHLPGEMLAAKSQVKPGLLSTGSERVAPTEAAETRSALGML
jgi:hypothetical protein